ncbi:response regulator transcription factor [Nocardia terpenica]|uniref:DNA-binding response regulator n=1 Tax=Nocardia terpenica TaxID=455432 RepID=A0A291RLI3_9NOCA|nr:response regulator transcription factor [Nocardia terpenica]ATL68129.1 DNA-binding response regulator [Nocardia terpenica]
MRVVLAEDSLLLREGLVRLLDEAGATVVEAVGDGDALIRAVVEHHPDIAVTDVRMPPSFSAEGLRAALEARRQVPGTAVLVLSQYVEQSYASDLLSDAQVGGVGYLLKDRISKLEELADALHRVAEGGTVLDPEVVAGLFARRTRGPLDELTPRERQVLELMAEGRTNRAISKRLTITEGAVEKYISAIFTKLNLPPSDDDHRRVLAVVTWLQS